MDSNVVVAVTGLISAAIGGCTAWILKRVPSPADGIAARQQEIDRTDNLIEQLQEQVRDLRGEKDKRYEQAVDLVNTLQLQVTTLWRRMDEVQSQRDECGDTLDSILTENAEQKKELNALRSDNVDLRRRIATLERSRHSEHTGDAGAGT